MPFVLKDNISDGYIQGDVTTKAFYITDVGTYTGNVISNGVSLPAALQELETKIESEETEQSNHIANTSNPHSVTKAQVGLGNVDNTSDADKPISTAAQSALNQKYGSGDNVNFNNSNSTGAVTHANQDVNNPQSSLNVEQADDRYGRKWQHEEVLSVGVGAIDLPDYLWSDMALGNVRSIMLAVTITLTTSATEDRYSSFILSVRLRRGSSGNYLHQLRIDKNTIFAGGYFSGTTFTPIGHGVDPSSAQIEVSDSDGVIRRIEISQL